MSTEEGTEQITGVEDQGMPSRTDAAPRRRPIVGALVALALVGAPVASALGAMDGHVRVDAASRPPLVSFYDYGSGSPRTWTDQADFASGSATDLDLASPPGSAVLATGTTPWWDPEWTGRGCYVVDHDRPGAATVSEYPVRISLNTVTLVNDGVLESDGADLRAVAADGATLLPLWLEGPVPSPSSAVWIQVDDIPAGGSTHFCLYWGNSKAASVSDEAAVFHYTTLKPLYYAVSGRYDSHGAAISVVSLVDDNQASNGVSTTPTGNTGGTYTFPAGEHTSATVISARGPLAARGVGNGFDTLVPISWAGTRFVFPTQRSTQSISIHAPFATATVDIANGTTPVPASPVTVPAGATVTVVADVTWGSTGVVTSDVPVLVTHVATNGSDAFPLPPLSGDALYGVRSRNVRIGAFQDASGTITWSDGDTTGFSEQAGDRHDVGGGGSQGGGSDDGARITAGGVIGAITQADSDGADSVVFLPGHELGATYYLPTDAQYVAIACPSEGTRIRIEAPGPGGVANLTCSGSAGGPGWVKRPGGMPAGTLITSRDGLPFYLYYEDAATDDETNVLGLRQGRQYTWPEPRVTAGEPDAGYAPSGTWESATVDTAASGVFGTLAWAGSAPPGTSVRFQVATAASDPPLGFVGPDGTPATWYEASEEGLAFTHDGDRYLRVRAVLATSDPGRTPRLDEVTVTFGLTRFPHDAGSPDPVPISASGERHWVARIVTAAPALAGSSASLSLAGISGIGGVAVGHVSTTRPEVLGVAIDAGAVTVPSGPPIPFDASLPHSIVLDEQVAGPAVLTIRWRLDAAGLGTTSVEHLLALEVTP